MSYVSLVIEPEQVATLTMNRAEVHNAFDDSMINELRAVLAEVTANPKVRVLVLKGAGKNFSAGADLAWMRAMAQKNYQENITDAENLGALMWELKHLTIPTIALVQGAVFGGAVGLVACCDLAVATENATFCLSEVKIGLIPAVISPYIVQAMGPAATRRYTLTAERFNATTAQQHGLVHEVVTDIHQAEKKVAEFVHTLCHNSPAALMAAKSLLQQVTTNPLNETLVAETVRRIAEIRVSPEGQEGLNAFLAKRPAAWLPPASAADLTTAVLTPTVLTKKTSKDHV